ncbi:MAG: hypothetical protein RLY93_09840 [Sumerlaeia bacterium]
MMTETLKSLSFAALMAALLMGGAACKNGKGKSADEAATPAEPTPVETAPQTPATQPAPDESSAPVEASKSELSPESQQAYETLAKAEVFATTVSFGIGQQTPQEIIAFQTLLRDADAKAQVFQRLYQEENPVAKLYALSGLYWTDMEAFDEKTAELGDVSAKVQIMNGAVRRSTTVNRVVKSNSANAVRLSGPEQSIGEWVKANPDIVGDPMNPNYVLDIAGGGYPRFLRDAASY